MNNPINLTDPSGLHAELCSISGQLDLGAPCQTVLSGEQHTSSLLSPSRSLPGFNIPHNIHVVSTCSYTTPRTRPVVINGNVAIIGLLTVAIAPSGGAATIDRDWLIDCVLSGISTIATGAAMAAIAQPEIAVVPIAVDLVVSTIGVIRTEAAFNVGEISQLRRYILNTTAIVGLLPIRSGLASSLVNTIITCLGIPQ